MFACPSSVIDVMVLLLWLFFIFGVIGVQAFGGQLKQRCFHEAGGVLRTSTQGEHHTQALRGGVFRTSTQLALSSDEPSVCTSGHPEGTR